MISQKHLFETTSSTNVYGSLTFRPVWAIAVSVENLVAEFAWCEISHQGKDEAESRIMDYAPRLRINNVIIDSYDGQKKYDWVFDVASEIRATQVREEVTPEGQQFSVFGVDSTDERIKEAILALYYKASNGEYVGQRQGSMVYVETVAKILDLPQNFILSMIDELTEEKKLALNGMILWDWAAMEKSKQRLQEQTGHKELSRSDFGFWACHACNKHGDDYSDPKQYVCDPDVVDKDDQGNPLPLC